MDASVIVLDCLADLNTSEITARTVSFVRALRAAKHATTPIVLTEGTPTPGDWLARSISGNWGYPARVALRAAYDTLTSGGDTHVHYVAAADMFQFNPNPLVNPTVWGEHPADLGQYLVADFYAKLLPSLIG